MLPIYNFNDYKEFINSLVQKCPNRGRGVYARLAKSMDVSSVLVSQVLKGDRNFSRDKLFLVTQFFELDELNTEYLITLFDFNLSKSESHKKYLQRKLKETESQIKNDSANKKKELNEEQNKVFFSSWLYKATLLLLEKRSINTVNDLAYHLSQPRAKILNILEFLETTELISKMPNGTWQVIEGNIQAPKGSVHELADQMNLKNLEIRRVIEGLDPKDYNQSVLLVASETQIGQMKEQLSRLFKEFSRSPAEAADDKMVVFSVSMLNLEKSGEAPTKVNKSPVREDTFV